MVACSRISRGLNRPAVNGEHVDLRPPSVTENIAGREFERGAWIDGDIIANCTGAAAGAAQDEGAPVDERIAREGVDPRKVEGARTGLGQRDGIGAVIADDGSDIKGSRTPLLHDEVVGAGGIASGKYARAADGDGIGAGHEQTTGGQRHRVSTERDRIGTRRGELQRIKRQRTRGSQCARRGREVIVHRGRAARRRQRGVGRHRGRTRRGATCEIGTTNGGPREDAVGRRVGEDDAVGRADRASRVDDIHRRAGGTRDGTEREE